MNTNNITIIIYSFCYEIFVKGILSLSRTIRLFNMSDSSIIQKDDQSEFFSLREGILIRKNSKLYNFINSRN